MASPVVEYFEGLGERADELVRAVDTIMKHADGRRRLGVRANADTPDDAGRARRFGASGIGLCRTEHMFLGDRRVLIEDLILADSPEERQAALDALEPLQKADFAGLFTAMNGLPVTDPPDRPAAARVPARHHRPVGQGRHRQGHARRTAACCEAVQRLHEQNPMLGLRGVRLGLVVPGLFAMQVRAIAEAAKAHRRGNPSPRS